MTVHFTNGTTPLPIAGDNLKANIDKRGNLIIVDQAGTQICAVASGIWAAWTRD